MTMAIYKISNSKHQILRFQVSGVREKKRKCLVCILNTETLLSTPKMLAPLLAKLSSRDCWLFPLMRVIMACYFYLKLVNSP